MRISEKTVGETAAVREDIHYGKVYDESVYRMKINDRTKNGQGKIHYRKVYLKISKCIKNYRNCIAIFETVDESVNETVISDVLGAGNSK